MLASAGKRPAIQEHAGHSPAERQPIALHRADLRRALRPPEFLCAKLEALEQMPRGERKPQSLINLWFVQNA